jgi:hypothetical protein
MVETKLNPQHGTMEQRIANRLKNSGGEQCDTTVKTGNSPQRVFHNIHPSGSAKQHGTKDKGSGGWEQ